MGGCQLQLGGAFARQIDCVALDAKGLQADVHRDNNAATFDLERDQEARQSN